MNGLQTIRMALKSILGNKVRSLLTMLGIIIGVAAVITLVSSIQSKATLTRMQYEAMGTNSIQIYGWGAKSKDWEGFEALLDGDLKGPHQPAGRRGASTGTGITRASSTAP